MPIAFVPEKGILNRFPKGALDSFQIAGAFSGSRVGV
jgi:hypothetical protein